MTACLSAYVDSALDEKNDAMRWSEDAIYRTIDH